MPMPPDTAGRARYFRCPCPISRRECAAAPLLVRIFAVHCGTRQMAGTSLREAAVLTETTDTDPKTRAARLEARMTTDQKALLQHAAALSGRTLSEFVVASAQEAAARVIQEHETIRLSRSEQVAFVTALLKPRAPNARLRKAAEKYRQQTGL